jgi:hypothetical protein
MTISETKDFCRGSKLGNLPGFEQPVTQVPHHSAPRPGPQDRPCPNRPTPLHRVSSSESEISAWIKPGRGEAEQLAREHHQLAIFDIGNMD